MNVCKGCIWFVKNSITKFFNYIDNELSSPLSTLKQISTTKTNWYAPLILVRLHHNSLYFWHHFFLFFTTLFFFLNYPSAPYTVYHFIDHNVGLSLKNQLWSWKNSTKLDVLYYDLVFVSYMCIHRCSFGLSGNHVQLCCSSSSSNQSLPC